MSWAARRTAVLLLIAVFLVGGAAGWVAEEVVDEIHWPGHEHKDKTPDRPDGDEPFDDDDEEDLLECGIEIVARPPGKRLQNLMLLSGGEKALTAIALLFALFRIKPSPFCILDEVDAPLDDVNTLRFIELLAAMAADTQFIVITHNKLTMEAAGTLYGVTMEEKGVSKLVAVEIDDVQPPAAEASASTATVAAAAGA